MYIYTCSCLRPIGGWGIGARDPILPSLSPPLQALIRMGFSLIPNFSLSPSFPPSASQAFSTLVMPLGSSGTNTNIRYYMVQKLCQVFSFAKPF